MSVYLEPGLIKLLLAKDENPGDLRLHPEIRQLGDSCPVILEGRKYLFANTEHLKLGLPQTAQVSTSYKNLLKDTLLRYRGEKNAQHLAGFEPSGEPQTLGHEANVIYRRATAHRALDEIKGFK